MLKVISMRFLSAIVFVSCLTLGWASAAHADRYPTAVFSGLDKISANVSQFTADVNKPVRYGSLQITVYACHKKPPEETPQTSVYVEVHEVMQETQEVDPKPLFKGWMFAESPGINGLEHPVYDIWLNTCKGVATPEPDGNL